MGGPGSAYNITFLKSHTIQTREDFLVKFSSTSALGMRKLYETRKRLLQRFMQAFFFARPSTVMNLPRLTEVESTFVHSSDTLDRIDHCMRKYKRAFKASTKRPTSAANPTVGPRIALAVEAYMISLHPLLWETMNKTDIQKKIKMLRINPSDSCEHNLFGEDGENSSKEQRRIWLKQVATRPNIIEEAPRVKHLMVLLHKALNTSDSAILIFDSFLKMLDIVDEAIYRTFGFRCLRIDRTVSLEKRQNNEKLLGAPGNQRNRIMLITEKAGGVALNLAAASIIIQLEPWWNRNQEKRSIARAYRQGQQHEVSHIKLVCRESMIDMEILNMQSKKEEVINGLMAPLVRDFGQPPEKIELLTGWWDKVPQQ